jgi:AhpD family alkylhydroperoxidase
MTHRPNPYVAAPNLMQQWIAAAQAVTQDLEPDLKNLVKIRASQINGCAICLDMHAHEARAAGETETRILMLDAWRECDLYTLREKAALAWTESLTRLHQTGAPDADYDIMAAEFTEQEQIQLTMTIAVINAFNTFGVGFRVPPLKRARQAA